ncbi:MAG TPA: WYL domain-containing protein, partial [Actinomycetota bacterium]|nr:WYL domain-containing protein [Actinomycetota bacterium]
MLAIVPYLVQHPGSALTDVATAFGMPPSQLRRDLDLLFMSGLPPYGPGDLIDVDVDEDGHIWIAMADHFSRPLQLTRIEALAVYLR